MLFTRNPGPAITSEERAHLVFWSLGAVNDGGNGRSGHRDDEMLAVELGLADRVRRLPEAMLLTAGYYASQTPVLGRLIRVRG